MPDHKKLDRQAIVAILADVGLPESEYWVLMGAAMVLHGLRDETQDIDLGCRAKPFDALASSRYPIERSGSGRQKVKVHELTTVYRNWVPASTVCIEGFQVAGLESILADKVALARKKDTVDILLLRQSLGLERT